MTYKGLENLGITLSYRSGCSFAKCNALGLRVDPHLEKAVHEIPTPANFAKLFYLPGLGDGTSRGSIA